MDSGSPPSGPGVISGVGELDLDKGLVKKVEPSTKDKPYPDCPFLLLDKNAHGKIIILYDDDERLASQAATTMCERGFENLFMLSGGRLNQGNASGRNSKVPGARSGQNLPAGGPASHQNPRSLGSGHLQGKPWK
ncbi:hypothetical protein J1605_009597 [Eschrichtius robustus]|uniref:Rhodanese domain-containing protein n=1 Tax=Eschrichtius robustus TaxID=9764 RepID=A0AB34GX59_ESCRO|nr:hypothetical protein J1605_009597 [Eschrichtius robustus]